MEIKAETKETKKLTVYSIAVIRLDGVGAGGVFQDEAGNVVASVSSILNLPHKLSGHELLAEYRALLLNLDKALELEPTELELRLSNEVLVGQLKGELAFKTTVAPQHKRATRLLQSIPKFEVVLIDKEGNAYAEELASEAIKKAFREWFAEWYRERFL